MTLSYSERADLLARGYSQKDVQQAGARLRNARYRVDTGSGQMTVAASIAASFVGRTRVITDAVMGRRLETIHV